MYKFNKEEIVNNIALEKYFEDMFDRGFCECRGLGQTKVMTKENFAATLIQMVNKQIIELKK